MSIRSQFNQGLNCILLRLFGYFGRGLASRIKIHYHELLVRSLFESHTAGSTKYPAHSNARNACEIFVEVAINKIATESDLSSQSAARDIAQLLIHGVKNRAGDSQVKIGLDNENNRDKWLEKTLGGLPSNIRLLDAGAGEQQYKKYCQHLNYVSQDFAQYDGLGNSEGLQTGAWSYGKIDIVSDICNIPEPNASFDAILCTEVFEHISNPIDAIMEFARLLKPGGILILSAPFSSLTHFAPYYYYTGFSRFFYEKILRDNGFGDINIEFNSGYFDYLSQELHRLPSIAERYASETLSEDLKANSWLLLETLSVCAAHDKGSSELLTYGLHVTAKRI